MTNVNDTIFLARPRHDYKSYTDYLELIRLSGFPLIFIDEIPPEGVKDNVYICSPLNGEWQNGIQTDARIVHWCLEYWREQPRFVPGVETWHMDKWQAETYGARYTPVGGHPGLCPAMTPKQDVYDTAFIGYINGVHRRERIRHELLQRGVTVSPTGAWGDERHALLRNSASYLHVHQWEDIPAVPALRMVVAAAYALPVITETVADAGIFTDIYSLGYGAIAENVAYWMRNSDHRVFMDTGMRLHEQLCKKLTFRKSIESAL